MILLIVMIIFGLVGSNIAKNKGYEPVSAFIACALTGIIGVLIFALYPAKKWKN